MKEARKTRWLVPMNQWMETMEEVELEDVEENDVDDELNNYTRIKGIICNSGRDFVDIKLHNHRVVTIMKNRIRKIEWPDKRCNPCSCRGRHDHHHDNCCNCHYEKSCYIPVCHGRAQLRLAGLINDLSFQLFKMRGCKVIVEISS